MLCRQHDILATNAVVPVPLRPDSFIQTDPSCSVQRVEPTAVLLLLLCWHFRPWLAEATLVLSVSFEIIACARSPCFPIGVVVFSSAFGANGLSARLVDASASTSTQNRG